ncbi:MAG: PepSY domain-containing protein [Proteobacteria bacterium]|nr:PepSY domain-containing protein [Pseudomonadota bacterium]
MKRTAARVMGVMAAAGLLMPMLDASAASPARIDKTKARHVALARVPDGIVRSAELERENGVWVWSFDIARPHTHDITEILVNAQTGAIVQVTTETPAQQQAESRADARAASPSRP